MIDSVVEIFVPTTTKTSDGTLKKVWAYTSGGAANATIVADVQPKSLSEAQLKQWGLSTLSQDAKVVYDFNDNPYFALLNRARVDGDTIYDIRGVNKWESHCEYVLVPVAGQ
mgnify:CR=1 FL=1